MEDDFEIVEIDVAIETGLEVFSPYIAAVSLIIALFFFFFSKRSIAALKLVPREENESAWGEGRASFAPFMLACSLIALLAQQNVIFNMLNFAWAILGFALAFWFLKFWKKATFLEVLLFIVGIFGAILTLYNWPKIGVLAFVEPLKFISRSISDYRGSDVMLILLSLFISCFGFLGFIFPRAQLKFLGLASADFKANKAINNDEDKEKMPWLFAMGKVAPQNSFYLALGLCTFNTLIFASSNLIISYLLIFCSWVFLLLGHLISVLIYKSWTGQNQYRLAGNVLICGAILYLGVVIFGY